MHNKNKFMCPVCGYEYLEEKPYDKQGNASFEICPSCGTEFGYDDANKSNKDLRAKWIKNGKNWWSKSPTPKNWDPDQQLENLKKD